jgi:hypothetical protein
MTEQENSTKVDTTEEDVNRLIENSSRLLEKYDDFIEMLDHRNMLYYGALFRQMYADFATEEDEDAPIKKSIDELAKILEKAAEKLNFDIQNANIKQLSKLFSLLVKKLNGTDKLRSYDQDILEPLVSRMYNDKEVLELLMYLEEKGVKPEYIVAINEQDKIVFKNKKTYGLPESEKLADLIDFLAENAPKEDDAWTRLRLVN